MAVCREPSTSTVYAKLVNPLLCFVIIIIILYVGQGILKPLAFSALIALLLVAPCRFLEKKGLSRGLSTMICLLLGLLAFLVVFYFVSISIVSFRKDLPQMVKNIEDLGPKIEAWVHAHFSSVSTDQVHEFIQSSTEEVIPTTSAIVNTTLNTVTGLVFLGIMVFIITFLLLLYRGLIVLFFTSFFAEKYTDRIHAMFNSTRFIIRSYIVGLFIEMIVVGIAYCSVLFFLGVKYAFLLAVIGAILNIIPYVGIFLTCVLCALITITTNTPVTVVWVIISLIIIHMIDSNILMTKIVGSKVKINALATIIGVIVGSALWGIPGTFMAVPIMAILKVVFEDIPAFQPFALIMGDDVSVRSVSGPMVKRLARTVKIKMAVKND